MNSISRSVNSCVPALRVFDFYSILSVHGTTLEETRRIEVVSSAVHKTERSLETGCSRAMHSF
jgi:hypothetical protein